MSKPGDRKAIVLRVPMDLYPRIKKDATDEGIGVTAFILRALRRSYETQAQVSLETRVQALEKTVQDLKRNLGIMHAYLMTNEVTYDQKS